MTLKEIADMINAMGFPFAYYQFEPDPENPPPAPPFVCFYYPTDDDFMADDGNYAPIKRLVVELYTDNKDFTAEAAVETQLAANGLPWSRTETYIDSEKLYMVSYTSEVVING